MIAELDLTSVVVAMLTVLVLWVLILGLLIAIVAKLGEMWRLRRAKKRVMKLVGHTNSYPFPRTNADVHAESLEFDLPRAPLDNRPAFKWIKGTDERGYPTHTRIDPPKE